MAIPGRMPWTPRKDPVTATLGGLLALGAALAAALGTRVAPPFFGGMVALALAAEAGLGALGAPATGAPRATAHALAWALLGAGWLAFAVLLLHLPLGYQGALRALITLLIGGGLALRTLDWQATPECGGAGALTAFCAAAAIAVAWLGGSPTLAANPVAAMATGATFELLGTAGTWLGSAWVARATRRGSGHAERTAVPAMPTALLREA